MSTKCRRCSDCQHMNHHWMRDGGLDDDGQPIAGEFGCKHCDQRGDECTTCESNDGTETLCPTCDGEGVVPLEEL